MAQKHTKESFNNKLQQINPNLTIIGEYVDITTKTQVFCKICNHIWEVVPKNIIVINRATGCPKCYQLTRIISTNQIDEIIKEQQIQRIGNIIDTHSVIEWKCLIDQQHPIWKTSVTSIIHNKTGCPTCANNIKYSIDIINELISSITPNIKMIGPYLGMSIPTTFQCSLEHTWDYSPSNIIHHKQIDCPVCTPYQYNKQFGKRVVYNNILFKSKLEADCYILLQEYTSTNEYSLQHQKRYPGKNKYSCDFYIPELKNWIEVSSFSNEKYLNRIKTKQSLVFNIQENFIFASSLLELTNILELPFFIKNK